MRILVIDVACEGGGALSVLRRFIDRFSEDTGNEYMVCVAKLDFENRGNIQFVKYPWVKKSYLHRMYFDSVCIRKIIKNFHPDVVFSLQNKGFDIRNIKQSVYFLGKCTSDNIVCQEDEVAEASFLSYEKALEILTFEETKNILKSAELFIRSN